ncbi:MAG: hypothetical protein A3C38_03570 [Planctomycetes bacterium RIFCSPHIGHO2_02_FULL_50_42]|nr:MAG: hypothetical protein A2060_05265 [Planctomycetes bacterium GWA2_50_13]OHB88768.1 MAG: hypothetical protein A3C38_03570 [Planctomycetes bacterium RIFCSPHIGHO2_02_FULL_50_42]OHB92172.1 MAG: hypothetical protein A3E75_03115 [Planctomycetes bacterium RIFCSPHIGHO2_12_FULL_51_37]OHB94956.1 MAG: hypothetical protein A3I59_01505 [Planctomycetes bacterium RIFCSPLOWO2_02_FULL_50_16]OHC03047.1 MAG: hypothetical protein A3G17_00735 [Planctomycetes bacterium RIFCSPLOWO2_12_FULL_50_35]
MPKTKWKDVCIKVKAYSGYKAEERPLAFTLRDKEYKIEEILETYAEEREGRRLTSFRVRTHEGVFKIYYCGEEGRWYWER